MVGIDSLYLFQIPQLTLSPHLSFSIQAQLVFSHLLPDPTIPCFEPACSAEFLRERGLSLRKGKASLFTHCALRISLRMGWGWPSSLQVLTIAQMSHRGDMFAGKYTCNCQWSIGIRTQLGRMLYPPSGRSGSPKLCGDYETTFKAVKCFTATPPISFETFALCGKTHTSSMKVKYLFRSTPKFQEHSPTSSLQAKSSSKHARGTPSFALQLIVHVAHASLPWAAPGQSWSRIKKRISSCLFELLSKAWKVKSGWISFKTYL